MTPLELRNWRKGRGYTQPALAAAILTQLAPGATFTVRTLQNWEQPHKDEPSRGRRRIPAWLPGVLATIEAKPGLREPVCACGGHKNKQRTGEKQ